MSYYPILRAPQCTGWVTVSNFSPNNWEQTGLKDRYVNITWSQEGVWKSKNIGILAADRMMTINSDDVAEFVPNESLPFISLTDSKLPEKSNTLPSANTTRTNIPTWRSTLGLSTENSSTSYQGEIDPFPSKGTLLTFCPFIQYGNNVENYLLLINLEEDPHIRSSNLEFYRSDAPGNLLAVHQVKSNSVTSIKLDDIGYLPNDLPLILSRETAGIPLYFSCTKDGSNLSMEHTHPPASYVVHGGRWVIQKLIKKYWMQKTVGYGR